MPHSTYQAQMGQRTASSNMNTGSRQSDYWNQMRSGGNRTGTNSLRQGQTITTNFQSSRMVKPPTQFNMPPYAFQSRRETERMSTFQRNMSGNSQIMITNMSHETNLQGQGEFGKKLLKVVAKQ